MHRRVRFVVPASRRVERYYQCNSDRAPARSGTPPPQPTEVLVAVARKPGKPLLLGDPLIDCRDAARQRIFTGCILADSRLSCLTNSSEERSHDDGHSILPGRRQTLRRKCDRRPDWAQSAATLASHAEEASSHREMSAPKPRPPCPSARPPPRGSRRLLTRKRSRLGLVLTPPATPAPSRAPYPSPSWPHARRSPSAVPCASWACSASCHTSSVARQPSAPRA